MIQFTSLKLQTNHFIVFLVVVLVAKKTHVLKALCQTTVKYNNSLPGKDFDTSPVLHMARTGKAACNILGTTIHNAMKIPANQK